MRRLFSLIASLVLVGCSSSEKPSEFEQWMQSTGKAKVLSTTAIIDDLVGQIGGGRVDHISLIGRAIDPHSYELVKGDDEKFSQAQLVVFNGLGLEHSASLVYQLQSHPKAVAVGGFILHTQPKAILVQQGQCDPHIWLDMRLWADTIPCIVNALIDIDPEGHDFYLQQGEKVRAELLAVDTQLAQQLQQIPAEKRYLITSHNAFNYFAKRYLVDNGQDWKSHFCAPEGLSPDGQLSCQDIQAVIDYLTLHKVEVVFPEWNVNRDSLIKIVDVCHEKGMPIKMARKNLYSDTLTSGEHDHQSYLAMMEHNVSVICEAWGE